LGIVKKSWTTEDETRKGGAVGGEKDAKGEHREERIVSEFESVVPGGKGDEIGSKGGGAVCGVRARLGGEVGGDIVFS